MTTPDIHAVDTQIQDHYVTFSHREAVMDAIAEMKAAGKPVTPAALAAFDQLHTGGAGSTQVVIDLLAPTAEEHVLDVGSGMGGPARMMAAQKHCRVTGVDLTADFVETANLLTAETGQTDRVVFQQGSALDLPFAEATFDAAFHLHMSMNIADKARMYAAIFRTLKPGARFALYDPILGPNVSSQEAVTFPVPWAQTAETSFLRSQAEMMDVLAAVGFQAIDVRDATPDAMAWFAASAAAKAAAARDAQRQDSQFALWSKNHRTNLATGAVMILSALFRKPA